MKKILVAAVSVRKILVVAVLVLFVASFAFSRTSRAHADNAAPGHAADCLLTFITESLPNFYVNQPANVQLEVCCGTPPYHFEVTGGALPEGLHLNANGKITGKPRAVADTTVFVTVTDSAGCMLTQAFAVRVDTP